MKLSASKGEPGDLRLATDRFPTLDHVWIAALFLVIAVRALAWPITPSDFWWQIAYGRSIVELGAIPAVDTFSFTRAGEPYFDQPWLAQILMYGIFRLGGPALSLIGLAATLWLSYALLLRVSLTGDRSVRLATVMVMLSLPVAMTNWSVRSQVLAIPLFVAYIGVLRGWRGTSRERPYLWVLPVLMVVWVNLHGSFVLGGLLVTLFFLGELSGVLIDRARGRADSEARGNLKALFLWGCLTAAAVFVNPRGAGVLEYVFSLLGGPAIQSIVEEWQPPTTQTIVGQLFFLYVVVVGAAAVLASRRPDLTDVLVLGVFFWLALSGERHVMWFAVVSVPFMVEQLASVAPADRAPESRQGNWSVNLAFLGTMAVAVLCVLPPLKTKLPLPPRLQSLISPDTPVATVDALRTDATAPARLFHTETTGSYLMWAVPERKVFLDARVELYPLEQLQDYRMLNAGIAVDSLLGAYDIDGLLLDVERQKSLVEWARSSPDWEVRFEESCCSYWVRKPFGEM